MTGSLNWIILNCAPKKIKHLKNFTNTNSIFTKNIKISPKIMHIINNNYNSAPN